MKRTPVMSAMAACVGSSEAESNTSPVTRRDRRGTRLRKTSHPLWLVHPTGPPIGRKTKISVPSKPPKERPPENSKKSQRLAHPPRKIKTVSKRAPPAMRPPNNYGFPKASSYSDPVTLCGRRSRYQNFFAPWPWCSQLVAR